VAKVCEGICPEWQKYVKGYVRSGKSMRRYLSGMAKNDGRGYVLEGICP